MNDSNDDPKFRPKEVENKIQGLSDLPFVYSEVVYETVELLLRKRTTNRILDYEAIPQSFLFYLTDKLQPDVAIANIADTELFAMALGIESDEVHQMYKAYGWPTDDERERKGGYGSRSEIVEGRQPNYCKTSNAQWVNLKEKPDKAKFDVVLGALAFRHKFDMLESPLRYLKSDGIGIFNVPSDFFWHQEYPIPRPVNLQNPGPFGVDNEFYIQAALIIPTPFLMQWYGYATDDDEYLLIIENRKREDLFVGTITDNPSKNKELVENLEHRRKGTTMSCGFLTTMEYPSFDENKFVDEADSMGVVGKAGQRRRRRYWNRDRKVLGVRASAFIKDLKFIEAEESATSTDSVVIHLPKVDSLGTGGVEIVVDTTNISPSYLQFFLDASQKHRDEKFVEYQRTKSIIPFNKKFIQRRHWLSECLTVVEIVHTILNTYVPLPDVSTQLEVEKLATEIRDLSSHIGSLWNSLWRRPDSVQNVMEKFSSLSSVETMESWINLLPFPLASILWAYHATVNKTKKVEQLLFFFEALPQFFTTILVSGLYSDTDFFNENSDQWYDEDPNHRNIFLMSTMGNWIKYGRKVASFVRILSESDGGPEQIKRLFNNPSPQVIDTLTNEKLWRVLNDALPRRNNWKGHSGIVGEAELEKRLSVLEDLLSRTREIITDNLQSILFIVRAEEVMYSTGTREYRMRVLQGSALPFPEQSIKVTSEMESGQIYMLNRGSQTPLLLLPLVRLLKGEKIGKEACYFYNRVEGKRCRFISYHYEDEPEIRLDKMEVKNALDALVTRL